MSNDVLRDLGATVRTTRIQKGMSQETLAERAELHRTYISDVERGKRNLSLLSISKLASALGISICALFPFAGAAKSQHSTGLCINEKPEINKTPGLRSSAYRCEGLPIEQSKPR